MTEYDYSPEAYERYLATQARIANWVDGTFKQAPCDAFSPATPHVQALALQKEKREKRSSKSSSRHKERDKAYRNDLSDDDYHSRSSSTRHRKHHSISYTTHTSPQRTHHHPSDRDRRRDTAERDPVNSSRGSHRDSERVAYAPQQPQKTPKYDDNDLDYVFVEYSSNSTSTEKPSRPRAVSYSTTKLRPPHSSRSHTTPNLTLDLPPFPNSAPPVHDSYYNRYSGHSSHSSNTTPTRPSSGSTTHGMFPSHQLPPYSAPAANGQTSFFNGNTPKPHRSQTMPIAYGYPSYPSVDKNGYPVNRALGSHPVVLPIRNTPGGMKTGYPTNYPPDPSAAPQIPWSTYQPPSKQQSLLKRMFTGLTGKQSTQTSSSQPTSPTKSHKERPEKEGSMFMGGGSKRMTRKRSVSF